MWLSRLGVRNCRRIAEAELALGRHANILYGGNAAGKSSLLEALSILSRGRSFRTPRTAEVLRRGASELQVTGTVEEGVAGSGYPVGISKGGQHTRIRINHADVAQLAELSSHLPLTLVHPGAIELLSGSPAGRRALLDWIAFYRNPSFHGIWRQYQRALYQRNACLRQPDQRYALPYWTEQFASLQPALWQQRQNALADLQAALPVAAPLLASLGELQLVLASGFPAQVDASDAGQVLAFLTSRQAQELQQGLCLYGAHRADLRILLDGEVAARVASRGQLKLLAISLLLAQSHAIAVDANKRGIIALDDLAAELDGSNRQNLYDVLYATQQQLLLTATHPEPWHRHFAHAQVFHVEQGRVRQAEAPPN